jgi:hypothetical protein
MNPVAIQYIWQAIQDSERSDDLTFIDALRHSLRLQPGAATEPLRTPGSTLPAVTLPLLSRP